MNESGLIFAEDLPQLENPVLIAGFDGWGNALNISKGMVDYMIGLFKGRAIARINPDVFYLYHQIRPMVVVQEGILKSVTPPGGAFYAMNTGAGQRDLLILQADEPNLRWQYFVEEMFSLCDKLGIGTIITLGSFYDNVLHTDRIVSGYASDDLLLSELKDNKVNAISYQGPSAIHTTIQSECQSAGFQGLGLWYHCPYYLQGTTHLGILAHLGNLLSCLCDFKMDTREIEEGWDQLNEKIHKLIESNPDLANLVTRLRKEKVRGTLQGRREADSENQKIINIEDFLRPK
ncbi:MAG: PAC2 family protein [Proteobacteria bacterium]|nr:PAC2 family protein [Pseudomonadota bacterium]